MKIPFYTVIGPILWNNKAIINNICNNIVLSFAPYYVGLLGVLGVLLSIFDIIRIMKCGPILPGYLWRERGTEPLITPEQERDIKLICLVLSAEYYFLLIVGLSTNNPIFFMPFLLLYALIINLEFILFMVRTVTEGPSIQKKSILMSALMVYNWFSVACTFARLMSCCDL